MNYKPATKRVEQTVDLGSITIKPGEFVSMFCIYDEFGNACQVEVKIDAETGKVIVCVDEDMIRMGKIVGRTFDQEYSSELMS